MDYSHKKFWVALVLATFFLFITAVVLSNLAYGVLDENPIYLEQTVLEIRAKYLSELTPPDWVYISMWAFVVIYQMLWLMYAVSLLCRSPRDGKGFLYYRPPYMPRLMYITFVLSFLLYIGWIYLWTQEYLAYSFGAIVSSTLVGLIALAIAAYSLRRYGCDLFILGNKNDVRLNRTLVQNGLAAWTFWMFFLTIVNVGIVMDNAWGMTTLMANTVALAIYGGIMLAYFLIELGFLTTSMRFTVTPYIVFVVSMAGLVSRISLDFRNRIELMVLGGAAMALFMLFFKIVSIIYLNMKDPEPLLDSCDLRDSDVLSEDDADDDTLAARYVMQAKILLSQ